MSSNPHDSSFVPMPGVGGSPLLVCAAQKGLDLRLLGCYSTVHFNELFRTDNCNFFSQA